MVDRLPNINQTPIEMDDTIDILEAVGFMIYATLCFSDGAPDYIANGVQSLIRKQCDELRGNRDAVARADRKCGASKLPIRDIREVARICRVPVSFAEVVAFTATGVPMRENG